MDTCVACSKKYEGHNHHCDPKTETRIEALHKGHREFRGDRKPDFNERLANGFLLMGLTEFEG